MIKQQLHKKGVCPDMCFKEISDCRRFSEVNFYGKTDFKPVMKGFQVKYKKRTFLNW